MALQTQYLQTKQLGIVLDIPPEEVAPEFYTNGANVTFGEDNTERAPGYAKYAAATMPGTAVPIFTFGVTYNDIAYWLWMTEDEVWVTDGVTHFDITPPGLVATTVGTWTATILNGIPCFNNPNNPPMFWDLNTANNAQVLPGWPTGARCRSLRAVKYHLVALNITESGINYPNQVWWSAGAQAGAVPQEWLPTASNDAGDTTLGDSSGELIDAAPLRDSLMIYKGNASYSMQYVAGQYVYAFRKVFPSIGVQSLNCACELNGFQFVFTGQDFIRHDGQSFVSLVDKKVKQKMVRLIDPAQLDLCTIVPRVVSNQVWLALPIGGIEKLTYCFVVNADNLLVGNVQFPSATSLSRGVVSPIDANDQWDLDNFSWASDVTFWAQSKFSPTDDSIMFTSGNYLYSVGTVASADGQPIGSTVERLSMRISEGIKHQVVTQVVPRIEGQNGDIVQIQLGSQNFFGESITWYPAQNFIIGTTRGINQIVDGRYLSIRFSANTLGIWKLFSYFVKVSETGEY